MSSEKKKLYAIAIIDAAYLRDHKLRCLEDDSIGPPEFNRMLSLTGNWSRAVDVPATKCPFTGSVVREGLKSASKWKTLRGVHDALSRFESNPRMRQRITNELKGTTFQAHIVDITECWNNTVNTEIMLENKAHEIRLNRLTRKLI